MDVVGEANNGGHPLVVRRMVQRDLGDLLAAIPDVSPPSRTSSSSNCQATPPLSPPSCMMPAHLRPVLQDDSGSTDPMAALPPPRRPPPLAAPSKAPMSATWPDKHRGERYAMRLNFVGTLLQGEYCFIRRANSLEEDKSGDIYETFTCEPPYPFVMTLDSEVALQVASVDNRYRKTVMGECRLPLRSAMVSSPRRGGCMADHTGEVGHAHTCPVLI
ncbi:unnamed protein product [Vitrella brassicaformis CCMP3155]|uniref:Uncharacterized protein n=1 Tax=Vitrella brassicaformis (strain CCMP3155) TaxID=1169540 RepID=A0A0G4G1S1_VITBC|nr:unnamed protein product [Vitrella brassicaformis CCMP3155]|eukprot:CEM22002.1 unnamed protein product [Vitrella brassicaformis CCMP3155]